MTDQPADYDSPWKEAISRYFPPFMEFFFPQAYANINWERGYEFLDTELMQVVREAELGKRWVDKLVKVWRINGSETWVLVHIEIQSQVQSGFAQRMYVYSYRLFDYYERQVASLAVLADDQESWRPQEYSYEIWGCRVSLEFPVVKLWDYLDQWDILEQSPNPFAVLVMAHLKTLTTSNKAQERLQWKLNLVKGLYQRGYSRQDILEIFRLIDWMMSLPKDLQRGFKQEILRYEEENQMPYITSIEQLAIEEGREQGLQQGLQQGIIQNARQSLIDVLETRFQEVPSPLVELINQIEYPSLLNNMLKRAITIDSLAEFQEASEQLAFEEGIQQGRLQGARENLITILETRLGELPSSLIDLINQIESYSLLMTLHQRAITIGSVAEFQEMLAQSISQSADG